MSIVWVRKRVTSGKITEDVSPASGKTEYAQHWQVLTDTYEDGPITVKGAAELPQPYTPYEDGNDRDDTALATKIDAKRNRQKPLLWDVKISYKSTPGVDATGGGGSIDITHYLPSVRSWWVPYEVVVWKARLQLATETYATAIAKSKQVVANSCGEIYAAKMTMTKYAQAYEISRYEWTYRETTNKGCVNHVNSATFWGHDPGTVKMVGITTQSKSVENQLMHRVVYEFHIKDTGGGVGINGDSSGWGEDVIDHGMRIWCKDDGTAPATPGEATGLTAIKDKTGREIAFPVLLDGAGYGAGISAPVNPGSPECIVTWHYLEEADFGDPTTVLCLPAPATLGIVAE